MILSVRVNYQPTVFFGQWFLPSISSSSIGVFFEESGKMDAAVNTIFSNGQQTGRNIWLGVAAFVLFSANAIASRQAKKRSDEQPTAKNAEEPQEKETPQRIQDDKDKME